MQVRLQAQGLRAQLVQLAAGVEGELKRFIAKYVKRELAKPYVQEATTIDVGAAIERASRGLGPKNPADQVTDDLSPALEEEIREQAELFVPGEDAGAGPTG